MDSARAEEFRVSGGTSALIDAAAVTALVAEGMDKTTIYVPGGTITVNGSYLDVKTRLEL